MKIYGNAVGHPLPDPRKGMTMSGPINMNGQKIAGLNTPTANNEAANKGYVDANKVDKSRVVNNFTTTEEGYVADARALKVLNDTKLSMELLWENASPTSAFGAQTLNLDCSDAELFAITHLSSGYEKTELVWKDGESQMLTYTANGTQGTHEYNVKIRTRRVDISDDAIVFAECTYSTEKAGQTDENSAIVPTRIYKFKGVSA